MSAIRPPRSEAELIDWLRLLRSENVGPVTFRQLLLRYKDAASALEALPDLAARGGRRGRIRLAARAEAEREREAWRRLGARLLPLGASLYPESLAATADAPPILGVKGDIDLLKRPAVALVGARNASAAGRRIAGEIARVLAKEGFLVVSGLARGIDTAAHIGALQARAQAEGATPGATAAVVAGGLDIVYPRENAELQRELGECGLLVSEMPPGTEPQARHFPRRNRIISGLSLGVLVVEAALRSGSLITARMAGEQGREVMAVPGSPLDPRARGCNALLREGATLVETPHDVIEALNQGSQGLFADERSADYHPETPLLEDEAELEKARRAVLELLGPVPVLVDEVIRQCQFSPATVATVLLELELAGRCERHPGSRVALSTSGAVELL